MSRSELYEDPQRNERFYLKRTARFRRAGSFLSRLGALGKDDRDLVILRGVESRPYKELAVLLKKDAKVLAVCYQRALEKLRQRLPGAIFDDLPDG